MHNAKQLYKNKNVNEYQTVLKQNKNNAQSQ